MIFIEFSCSLSFFPITIVIFPELFPDVHYKSESMLYFFELQHFPRQINCTKILKFLVLPRNMGVLACYYKCYLKIFQLATMPGTEEHLIMN